MSVILSSAIASSVTLLVILLRTVTGVSVPIAISDGFFASGLVLVSVAALRLVYALGGFDPFIYAALRLSPMPRDEKPLTYRRFKAERGASENGRAEGRRGGGSILAVGAFYLIVGILLSAIA